MRSNFKRVKFNSEHAKTKKGGSCFDSYPSSHRDGREAGVLRAKITTFGI